MLEDSKSKGNESINIFIPKKKNNILNKNENSNQLLNPKKKGFLYFFLFISFN